MHRTLKISVSPEADAAFTEQLAALESVIGLSVHRGASIKPPGDVLRVHALNRGTDEVLKVVARLQAQGDKEISVATAEVASFQLPAADGVGGCARGAWADDDGCRSGYLPRGVSPHRARLRAAYQDLAEVHLAPPGTVRRGLLSSLIGYAVLVFAAALAFLALRALGAITPAAFLGNHEVEKIIHPDTLEFTYSSLGVLAGAVMLASYRRNTIGGALMALEIIHAAALVGVALGVGSWDHLRLGLVRFGADLLLILVLSAVVFWLKQIFVHRRRPLA